MVIRMYLDKPSVDELILDYLKRNLYISTEISFKRECKGLKDDKLQERLLGVKLENIVGEFCWEKQLENAEIEYLAKLTPIVLSPERLWNCFDKIVDKIKSQHKPNESKARPVLQKSNPVNAFSSAKGQGRRQFNYPTQITPKLHCVPITFHNAWTPVHKKPLQLQPVSNTDVQIHATSTTTVCQQNSSSIQEQDIVSKDCRQSTNRRKTKPKRLSDVERKSKEASLNANDLLNLQEYHPCKSLAKVGMKIMQSMKTCAPSDATSSGQRDFLGELLDANSTIEQQDNIISKTIDSIFAVNEKENVEYNLSELEMLLNDNSNLSNMEFSENTAQISLESNNPDALPSLFPEPVTGKLLTNTITTNSYSGKEQLISTARLLDQNNSAVSKTNQEIFVSSTSSCNILNDTAIITSTLNSSSTEHTYSTEHEHTSNVTVTSFDNVLKDSTDKIWEEENSHKIIRSSTEVSPKSLRKISPKETMVKSKKSTRQTNKLQSIEQKSNQKLTTKTKVTKPQTAAKSKKPKTNRSSELNITATPSPSKKRKSFDTNLLNQKKRGTSAGQSVISEVPVLSAWIERVSSSPPPVKGIQSQPKSTATTVHDNPTTFTTATKTNTSVNVKVVITTADKSPVLPIFSQSVVLPTTSSIDLAETAKKAIMSTIESNPVSENVSVDITSSVSQPTKGSMFQATSPSIIDLVKVKKNVETNKILSPKKKEKRKSSNKVSKKRKRKSIFDIPIEDINKLVKKIHTSPT